jgi:hypothetical protein
LISVKELIEQQDSFLNISASDTADKFRLTQFEITTTFGDERGQCGWMPGSDG